MRTKRKDTLLLIGDSHSDRPSLRSIFESKFYLLEAENIIQGLLLLEQNQEYVAAVLTDVPLSQNEALRSLTEICSGDDGFNIPVLFIITPSGTGENEEYAFLLGATDVVLKPYTTLSIQRRVQLLVDLNIHQSELEQLVEKQSESIRLNNQIMVDTLSSIIEYRSTESGNHVLRVRRFTKVLLDALAQSYPEYGLDDASIKAIVSAAALHDIGKISIPDSILNKPGKLTPEEYEIMKSHTTVGGQLVESIEKAGATEYLRYIYNIALYHHERWDGKGYPAGLIGDQIPICAQVVGLADAFDAMTTQRVYKPAYPYDVAANMILNGECGIFSPKLLECFKRTRDQFVELAQLYADSYSPKSDDFKVPLPGPARTAYSLDALQMSQLKYQTLLHYTNDTVIEMDLDNRIYHVVYNPNPDFVSLFADTPFDHLAARITQDCMHPEDAQQASQQYSEGMLQLFRQGGNAVSFPCRMYSPPHDDYFSYQIVLQRIHTGNPDQRMLLMIFHNLQTHTHTVVTQPQKSLLDSAAMYDLSSVSLCCLNDTPLTIREGAASLMVLTGYHQTEIWDLYQNSLVELVAPEDRPLLLRSMQSQDIRSGKVELDFRLQRKDGNPIWVQCRSRASIGPDGTEYRYQTLTDISRLKAVIGKLEATISRNHLLLDQAQNIVFEWDLLKDEVFCSDRWEERFGYSFPKKNFSKAARDVNHIHPDDLPALREKIRALWAGEESDMIDLRIANTEGSYYWSRIRAATVLDDTGRPTHIVGIIYDIDELKTDVLSMKKLAQRDELTQLLNKNSTQQQISSYLAEREADKLAAMLVLDLDNFKTVNDTLGHFYGDAVLKQVGSTLKDLFRAKDVVGRIGGDEFMILLKDIPSREMLEDRCSLLVQTIGSQMRQLTPHLPVSISVGAAMAPKDGHTYAELYRCADEALYSAKRKGKDQYNIYSTQNKYDTMLEPGSNTTRIDSEFRATMTDDSILQFAFQALYESRDIAATIQELLAFIGIRFNVSRVYIFENNEDNTAVSNTFEWCNVGIKPEISNLQNMSYATDLKGWPEVYEENHILYCTDVSELPTHFREIIEPQGIKSMLHSAIIDQGVFRGFVGFDECSANHLWTQGQVSLLKTLAAVLSVFVAKLRHQRKP